MNPQKRRVYLFTGLVASLALLCLVVAFRLTAPIPFTVDWWTVFGALLALALSAQLLALTISERGTTTTMDYVPELGAIIILGPFGAGIIAGLSWLIYLGIFTNKPAHKTFFNVSQFTFSVTAAGLVFFLLGGTPSLSSFDISAAVVPFAGAVVTHFATNRLTVSYIISAANNRSLRDVWQDISYTPFLFDLAASSLALALAFLYVEWGALALIAVILPLIGLRYSYGVNLELKQLNTDLLRVLIKTIEAQDPYTSGHSVRVAEGALAIGRELGLSARELNKIETAALLHDIGKIDSAYRRILTQEGALTEQQKTLIKKHPQRGVQLIRSVRSLDPDVLEYIKHHHERYDGQGYPDGLKGDDIPLGARIIMVSDALDAMVTSRAYRDALSPEETKKELVENKGTQFDPRVVDAALRIDLIEQHLEKAQGKAKPEPDVHAF